MTQHTYAIGEDSDESESLYWNGVKVQSTNHDDHGWEGMRAARELMISIARVVGAVEVDPPEIEDEPEEDEEDADNG